MLPSSTPSAPSTPSRPTHHRTHTSSRSLDRRYMRRLRSPNSAKASPVSSGVSTPVKRQRPHFRSPSRLRTPRTPQSDRKASSMHSRSFSDTSSLFTLSASKSSPSSPVNIYSDRYIPSRVGSNFSSALIPDIQPSKNLVKRGVTTSNRSSSEEQKDDTPSAYSVLVRNEMLDESTGPTTSTPKRPLKPRVLNFKATRKPKSHKFSLSPVGSNTEDLFVIPRREVRNIAKYPFKVLDAPQLKDDFYLNLVDWSSQNVLAVGLGTAVYTWAACTSKVMKLCDLSGEADSVTSVAWTKRGTHLAVGTRRGVVQIWDSIKGKCVRKLKGHSARVGTLAWNSRILASGSRDHSILVRDPRAPDQSLSTLSGHKQEVCGLEWSPNDQQLASGGNDNKLLIWTAKSSRHVGKFSQHMAAVKALSWSPHQHGLLASGGGTADRCIRFWNTLNNTPLSCVDTGSQVCNLMWSKSVNELVSSHGYSLNQIIVWKYPTMSKLATLTGHTLRVLYLSMSPDGQTIVTGAGDETLRFWNVFPSSKPKGTSSNFFFPGSTEIR